MGPGVLLLLSLLYYLASYWQYYQQKMSSTDLASTRNYLIYCMCYLLYFLLPNISTNLFNSFDCRDFDPLREMSGQEGRYVYLWQDLSVSCNSDFYSSIRSLSAIMLLVYPLGLPLAFVAVLYQFKDLIQHHDAFILVNKNMSVRRGDKSDKWINSIKSHPIYSLEMFYGPLKAQYWYFDIFDVFFRIILTSGLPVFIIDTELRFRISFLISVIVILMVQQMKPYKSSTDNTIMELSKYQILLSYFIGILGYAGKEIIDKLQDLGLYILDLSLLIINLSVVAAAIWLIYRDYNRSVARALLKESSLQTSRHYAEVVVEHSQLNLTKLNDFRYFHRRLREESTANVLRIQAVAFLTLVSRARLAIPSFQGCRITFSSSSSHWNRGLISTESSRTFNVTPGSVDSFSLLSHHPGRYDSKLLLQINPATLRGRVSSVVSRPVVKALDFRSFLESRQLASGNNRQSSPGDDSKATPSPSKHDDADVFAPKLFQEFSSPQIRQQRQLQQLQQSPSLPPADVSRSQDHSAVITATNPRSLLPPVGGRDDESLDLDDLSGSSSSNDGSGEDEQGDKYRGRGNSQSSIGGSNISIRLADDRSIDELDNNNSEDDTESTLTANTGSEDVGDVDLDDGAMSVSTSSNDEGKRRGAGSSSAKNQSKISSPGVFSGVSDGRSVAASVDDKSATSSINNINRSPTIQSYLPDGQGKVLVDTVHEKGKSTKRLFTVADSGSKASKGSIPRTARVIVKEVSSDDNSKSSGYNDDEYSI
jgi:hypothetical protein